MQGACKGRTFLGKPGTGPPPCILCTMADARSLRDRNRTFGQLRRDRGTVTNADNVVLMQGKRLDIVGPSIRRLQIDE